VRPPIPILIGMALARICAYGQATDASSFEVASMKPASPAASAITCSGGPGTNSPGMWRCSNVPLAFLVIQAYGFEAYQFPPSAPCCRDRFDVAAKMPEGTTREQFHRMIQNLLAERLKLRLHKERKEMATYELTVGENGPKMKESAADSPSEPEDPWAVPQFTMGKDGYPVFAAGRRGLAGGSGHYRWTDFRLSMAEIVKTLSFHLGRPVVDATGLKGKYDINMTWTIDLAWLNERAGLRDQVPDEAYRGPGGPTLIRAVQDQLGLKLSSKKGSGEVVVVDHVEKVPIGN
jgi:uncharacterized protein (TIGR03435 family)